MDSEKNSKKKLARLVVLPLLAMAVLVTPVALANGWFGGSTATPEEIAKRQSDKFQRESDVLGLNINEVKDAWAQGKSLRQIAEEHDINVTDLHNKMKELRQIELSSELKALVERGVITQSQADQRLKVMQDRIENGTGRGRHGGIGNDCMMH